MQSRTVPECGIILAMRNVKIDWGWVRSELVRAERIDKIRDSQQKRFIETCADECLDMAHSLVRPKAGSAKKPSSTLGHAKLVSVHLKNAPEVEIFIVSIGAMLEKEARRRMAGGDSLRGYLLDRIGSFAAESLAQSAEDLIRIKYTKTGKSVSARYSPGYCDFPIEKQRILSRLLPFTKAGVRLSKSCMMVPLKSVSAVVGIGKKGLFKKNTTLCVRCGKKDCGYRR